MKKTKRTASPVRKTVLNPDVNPETLYHIDLKKAFYNTVIKGSLVVCKPFDNKSPFRIERVVSKYKEEIVLSTEYGEITMNASCFDESDYYHVNDNEVEEIKEKKRSIVRFEGFQGIFKMITLQSSMFNLVTIY